MPQKQELDEQTLEILREIDRVLDHPCSRLYIRTYRFRKTVRLLLSEVEKRIAETFHCN